LAFSHFEVFCDGEAFQRTEFGCEFVGAVRQVGVVCADEVSDFFGEVGGFAPPPAGLGGAAGGVSAESSAAAACGFGHRVITFHSIQSQWMDKALAVMWASRSVSNGPYAPVPEFFSASTHHHFGFGGGTWMNWLLGVIGVEAMFIFICSPLRFGR
jgi:hypothetical protein